MKKVFDTKFQLNIVGPKLCPELPKLYYATILWEEVSWQNTSPPI